MRRSILAARAYRVLCSDSPYEQALLHGWHAVQSRGGRRQLRHCTSACLFRYLQMFIAVRSLMPLPFERGTYCSTACM
jgi:hypothetical protein